MGSSDERIECCVRSRGLSTGEVARRGAAAQRGPRRANRGGTSVAFRDRSKQVPSTGRTAMKPIQLALGLSLRAGPQFVFGEGPVRLYGFGTAGVSYFATESSLGGSGCGCWGYPSTVNYDDAVLALEGGGGLLIKLSRAVALDLGASYVRNGPVTYLREGGISRAADGSLVLRPVRSEANLAVAQLGVVIGLR